jgi:protein-tyrosine-phosphatase
MEKQTKIRVLFVCIGNACRSPMGEAIARSDGADVMDACSAGIYPLGMIPELTRKTLEAHGYSTEGLLSKGLQEFDQAEIDLVINMSGMPGPVALTKFESVEEWEVGDPYGEDAAVYQRILLEIQGRVRDLAQRLRERRQE